MSDNISDFEKFRAEMNEEILGCGHLGMKRFFALDHQAYESGALPEKTKELLGLVASAVLRCDDCITYHLLRCGEEGWKRDEVIDALNVALIVGGSIAIPHVRRAFARMREIPALCWRCSACSLALRTGQRRTGSMTKCRSIKEARKMQRAQTPYLLAQQLVSRSNIRCLRAPELLIQICNPALSESVSLPFSATPCYLPQTAPK
jgi:AhpD family alkylhydroperoxidase